MLYGGTSFRLFEETQINFRSGFTNLNSYQHFLRVPFSPKLLHIFLVFPIFILLTLGHGLFCYLTLKFCSFQPNFLLFSLLYNIHGNFYSFNKFSYDKYSCIPKYLSSSSYLFPIFRIIISYPLEIVAEMPMP